MLPSGQPIQPVRAASQACGNCTGATIQPIAEPTTPMPPSDPGNPLRDRAGHRSAPRWSGATSASVACWLSCSARI